ncbi:MAG: hypothetical protein IPN71_05495 [Fibrobacteres bacterium]|jgi:hypothetical protein|nr:hypothetical protein [Fibrobacterota bacterium]
MLSIVLFFVSGALADTGTTADTTFPGWHAEPRRSQPPPDPPEPAKSQARNKSNPSPDWVVVQEHPALERDSTVALEILEHPVMAALVWPFDNLLAPTAKFVLRPVRKAIRYGERTQVIDRGLRLVHPDSVETRWLYPVATLDGSEGSAWGLTYLDQDFLGRKWNFRTSGRVAVQKDVGGSLSLTLPVMKPLGQRIWGGASASRSQAQGVRIPGMWEAGDPASQGAVSMERIQWTVGSGAGLPWAGSVWVYFASEWLRAGEPLRWDLELPSGDSVPWLARGDRGTEGEETDRTVAIGWNWSDQNLSGAPSSGGAAGVKGWRTWAVGGGDAAGIEANAARYFLIGKERYIYRAEDLKPYLDLDAKEVVRILDPSTLRQRLTQRKILALHARVAKMWEIDPKGIPTSFYLFPSMGGGAPARAYPGSFLVDRAVAGISAEYRWPVWKYVDGTAFAEIAWADAGWWIPRWEQLAPGFGTGLRVRLDNRFLFRTHLSIGRVGIRYAMTSSSEF